MLWLLAWVLGWVGLVNHGWGYWWYHHLIERSETMGGQFQIPLDRESLHQFQWAPPSAVTLAVRMVVPSCENHRACLPEGIHQCAVDVSLDVDALNKDRVSMTNAHQKIVPYKSVVDWVTQWPPLESDELYRLSWSISPQRCTGIDSGVVEWRVSTEQVTTWQLAQTVNGRGMLLFAILLVVVLVARRRCD